MSNILFQGQGQHKTEIIIFLNVKHQGLQFLVVILQFKKVNQFLYI